jgi:hypothetical protein
MIKKNPILTKIVPFLLLAMALIFASGTSVAAARSQNPQNRDNTENRPANNNRDRNHDRPQTDRESGRDGEADPPRADDDNDNDMGDDDQDDTTPQAPSAEIFTAELTTEAETTPPVFDAPSDEADEEDENSEGDDEQTEEVLPIGAAIFKLVTRQEYDEETETRVDVSTLFYRLYVRNITDVTAAHIHVGLPGEDGEVVAFLFSGGPTGEFNGQLAEGIITEADLIGPLAGNMAELVELLRSGGLYVNVHTVMNPGGEIRGQITQ